MATKKVTKAYRKYKLDLDILEFVVSEKMYGLDKKNPFHIYDFRENTTRDMYHGLFRDTLDTEEKEDFDKELIYLLHGWSTRIINPISKILRKKIDNGEISITSYTGKKIRYTAEGTLMSGKVYKFPEYIPYHEREEQKLLNREDRYRKCQNMMGIPSSCNNIVKSFRHRYCDNCSAIRNLNFQRKRTIRDRKLANRVKVYYEKVLQFDLPDFPEYILQRKVMGKGVRKHDRQPLRDYIQILTHLPESSQKDFKRIVMGEEEE